MEPEQLTSEQRWEEWRGLVARELERQVRATQAIRTYIAVWFWLSVVGAVLLVVTVMEDSGY